MKKYLCIILSVCLLALSLLGCGSSNGTEGGAQGEKTKSSGFSFKSDKGLKDVTVYDGADEEILFGNYENEKYQRARYIVKDDTEKKTLMDELISELHYREAYESEIVYGSTEYSERVISDKPMNVSYEPEAITFGYISEVITCNSDGDAFVISDTGTEYVDVEWAAGDADGDIWGNSALFEISTSRVSEKVMKALESRILEIFNEEKALTINSNMRRLFDMPVMHVEWNLKDDGTLIGNNIYYTYKLDKDKIKYAPISINPDTLEVSLPNDSDWEEAQYGFRGLKLALKMNGYETELSPSSYINYEFDDDGYFYVIGYSDDRDNSFNNIGYMLFDFKDHNTTSEGYLLFTDGTYAENPIATLTGENTLSITWDAKENRKGTMAENAGSATFNFQSGYSGGHHNIEGFTLIDGDNLYYYYSSEDDYEGALFNDNLDGIDTENISDSKVEELVATQDEVVSSLKDGFKLAGINADIDERSGKVTMDNSILFGFDSAELSDEGKAYLDEFMGVYADIIGSQAQLGNVSQIKIIGHTDTQGGFDYNMELSNERAQSVADYCLSKYPELSSLIVSEGRSFKEPIYKEDGTVDMDKSRRVEFKAILAY